MATYTEVKVRLSKSQKDRIAHAAHQGTGVSIKLKIDDLDGDIPLIVTGKDYHKVMKHKAKGIGIVLHLSAPVVKKNKETIGGWVVPLLAGLAGSILPGLFGGQDQQEHELDNVGEGMYLSGSDGKSTVPREFGILQLARLL